MARLLLEVTVLRSMCCSNRLSALFIAINRPWCTDLWRFLRHTFHFVRAFAVCTMQQIFNGRMTRSTRESAKNVRFLV